MILTTTVPVTLNGRTRKFLEDKLYLTDASKAGDEFDVKVEDFAGKSAKKVSCRCDVCGNEYETRLNRYIGVCGVCSERIKKSRLSKDHYKANAAKAKDTNIKNHIAAILRDLNLTNDKVKIREYLISHGCSTRGELKTKLGLSLAKLNILLKYVDLEHKLEIRSFENSLPDDIKTKFTNGTLLSHIIESGITERDALSSYLGTTSHQTYELIKKYNIRDRIGRMANWDITFRKLFLEKEYEKLFELIDSHNPKNRFDIADTFGVSVSYINKILTIIGKSDYKLMSSGWVSNAEYEIVDFIRSIGIDVEQSNRSVLRSINRELDIYCKDKAFAIEVNGLWCHGDKSGKDKNYHLSKTLECKNRNISLFHIWDYEWMHKQDILKSMIMHKLNKTPTTIYARNCEIHELSKTESIKFFNENHIQGSCRSKYVYGLKYEDELVFAISFSRPRFNHANKWEIIRSCSKKFTSIPGAFSKIMAHFIRDHGTSIITYSEVRLGSLDPVYGKFFKLSHVTSPGWFATKDGEVFNRMAVTKQKLKMIHAEKYDDTLSAQDNMRILGYDRVWDCGQYVFVIK